MKRVCQRTKKKWGTLLSDLKQRSLVDGGMRGDENSLLCLNWSPTSMTAAKFEVWSKVFAVLLQLKTNNGQRQMNATLLQQREPQDGCVWVHSPTHTRLATFWCGCCQVTSEDWKKSYLKRPSVSIVRKHSANVLMVILSHSISHLWLFCQLRY